MLTRLSVGRVEPQELAISIGLLVLTIAGTAVIAIRIYGAGVLLYGRCCGQSQPTDVDERRIDAFAPRAD